MHKACCLHEAAAGPSLAVFECLRRVWQRAIIRWRYQLAISNLLTSIVPCLQDPFPLSPNLGPGNAVGDSSLAYKGSIQGTLQGEQPAGQDELQRWRQTGTLTERLEGAK